VGWVGTENTQPTRHIGLNVCFANVPEYCQLSLACACRRVSAKAVVTAAVASHWTEDLVAVSYWTAGASSALPSQLAAAVAAAAAVTSHKYVLPSANFRPKT